MGITINGMVVGASIGGRGADTTGWTEVNAGGVAVKFEPGEDLAIRRVQVGAGMMTTLMNGNSTSMNVNGVSIRTQGHDLWVNGEKVDFKGGAAAAGGASESKGPSAKETAKEKLEARFPGAKLTGHEFLHIDAGVQIAAGARVDGMPPGTVLSGDTKIGATAHVAGGTITDSQVDGIVHGGNLTDSKVAQGASVLGGNVRDSRVLDGGRIMGGNVRDSMVSGTIMGGNVRDMILEAGSTIMGGNVSDFTLKSGESLQGGTHSGGIGKGPQGAGVVIRGGNFSGDVNIVLGNVSAGTSVVGMQIGDIVIGGGRVTIGG